MAIIGTADYRSMQEKRYTNGTKELIAEIARRLERQNIPFSGRINGNYGTITVSGDENKRIVDAMAESLKTSFTRQPRTERRIIGNTDFRYIPKKVITSVDPAIADTLENTLKANNIPYSGVVVTNGDSQSTKITVSADNKPLLDRYADEAVRSIGVIAQLQDRGYSFDTSKGISVSYNGETLHYDTVAAFMSAYQSIDNGFFHPADYRVIRSVNDEGQPVYTLAEYSKDTGAPKNNGNTEEFYSVSSVERFIEENRNRINILTTADELQSFREMDMELMREQLVSRNRELFSSIDSLSYVLHFNEDGTGTLVYTDLGDIVQLTFDENAVRMAYEFASEYTEDIFTDTQQQRARVSVWLDGLEEYADVKTISDDSEEYEAYINYIKGAESSGNKLYLLDDDRSDGISLVDAIEGHYPEVTARKILDGYLSMNEQERAAFVSERENRTWENTNSTEYQLYDTIRRDINSQNPSVDFETAMGMWEQGIELKDAEGRVLTAEDGMPDILSSQIVHASAENKALYLGAVRFAHEIEDINESVVRTSPDSDLLDFMAQYAPDRYTGSFVISEEALEDYIKGNTAVYADWKEEIRELSLPDELKERIESLNIPIDDTPAVEEQTATVDLTEALAQIEALRRERDQWEAQAKANAAAAEDYRRQAGKFGDKQETTFAEQIHEVLHGTPNRYDDLKVCDTPKILQYIGCDDLPMLYTKEHLRKAVKPKDVHKHQHGLTEEFLATVPELMAEPVMVLDSMTRDDSLLVVLSSKETDPDNAPIVASVFPNGQGKYEMQLMPSNFVTSIYGRDNFETFINKCAEEDKILFADKEKSQELFSVLRLQFPQGFNNLSFNTIIHPSRNIVKPFAENISDNEQISEPKYRRQLREQSTEKSFEEQVDDVLAGKTNRYEDIKVCDTPKVLRDIGLDYLPMFYSQNHLRKAVAERNDAAHKHGLSVEQVKRMAELLADPAMVLDSITRDDTVIAVTDMLDDKNAPVIISIRPNGKGHYELEEVDSNFVTSMYGKDNFESFLNRTIEQDKVLYVSKEKSQELFRVLTLQLGKGVNSLDFTNLGSDIIIHQSRNIVKGSGENISENEQTAGRAVSEDVIEIETDGTSKAYFIDRTSAEIDREIDIPQLSQEDIEILRQLEPRKSVLNFTDEEMKLTEKWQERFAEIGEKSPYYRLQNGDWRENEQARVKILRVADHGRDFKGVRDDIKNGTINRGEFINADTGWTIQVSRHGLEDSVKYGVAKKDADTFNLMYHINELVENSVLLDSTVSDDNKQSKAFNTAFMHKMYSPVIIGETPYLAKLTVEEFGNSATKDTQRRLYNVRDIKIEPAENIGFTNESLARSFSESSDMSISDLYTLVKSFDEDFYLNKRTSEKEIQEERTETKETETEQLDLFSMPPEKTEEAPKQAREETTAQNEWHTVPDVSDDEGNPLEWAKKLDDGSFVWIDKEVYPDGTQFAVYNTSSHEFPPLETFATLEMAQEYVDEELNRSQEKHDFTITSDDFNTTHGQKNRFRQNVEAIRTLKQIEGENRLATPEEQQILSGYVGWGGIPEAFDSTKENWQEEYSELKELLTDDEYAAARASVTNAHYTSPIVIEAMYTALQNMGFEGGKVLDPSMGTGNFEGKMPEEMREKSRITGVELDSITGRMAKQLYQSADVQIKGFENTNFADNSFDVAISNVPFGNYKVFDKDYLKQNFAIHNYFFAKSLDKVHPGGIVAFVTSQYTMDSTDTKVREYLAQRAELLGAIRLPMGAFRDSRDRCGNRHHIPAKA